MTLTLYGHPFSSYCQKVLIALYENGTPFEFRILGLGDQQAAAELAALWPLKRMPVLVDGDRTVVETSIIIEHLGLRHPGPVRLIPGDAQAALEVRMMDRFFDLYVMTPMQKLVFDSLRAPADRDPAGVADARAMLDTAYGWLDGVMAGRRWAAGDCLQPRRLCCRSGPLLCRLGSSDRRGVRPRPCLPATAARAPVLRPRSRTRHDPTARSFRSAPRTATESRRSC